MVYPFQSNNGVLLKDSYVLNLSLVEKLKKTLSWKETKEFATCYITEGIPFAFKSNPLIFEEVRGWLSNYFKASAKNITITGSSRIGFSLSPYKWGRPHKTNSDLDLIIVSNDLFEDFRNDLRSFAIDIENLIKKFEKIDKNILNNIDFLYKTSIMGFIDQDKIPFKKSYPTTFKAYDVLGHLLKRLNVSADCPKPLKASIRVYKNWDSCISQLTRNFRSKY